MKEEEIKKQYNLHHTAWIQGYMSRKAKEPKIKQYRGKFGEGYTIEKPSWKSNRFHYIEYWIKK